MCNKCGEYYTLNPKTRAYSEEVRKNAVKTYYSGVSGRGIGKIFKMSKANVCNWIKKLNNKPDERKSEEPADTYESDELYRYAERKAKGETRENVYVITMISREPRQIVGHSAAADKPSERIQEIVDSAPEAKNYCTARILRLRRCRLSGKTHSQCTQQKRYLYR